MKVRVKFPFSGNTEKEKEKKKKAKDEETAEKERRKVGLERVQNFRVRAEPSLKFSRPSRAESKISEAEPSPSLGYQ